MARQDGAALSLFISYSHRDDDWRALLESHLALLKRQKVYDIWHDRRIGAGQEWAGQIDDALETASVVLLLVSSDFMASDYCYDKELKRALERHRQGSARVVPVIVRACDWQSSDFGHLQAVPGDGNPIAGFPDTDKALTEVAKELRRVAKELRTSWNSIHQPPDKHSATAGPAAHSNGADTTSIQTHTPPLEAAIPAQATPIAPIGAPSPSTAKRGLKVGSIKLGPLEIGPFELAWPARWRPAWAAVSLLIAPCLVGAGVYAVILKPPLEEARSLMRRSGYGAAAKALQSLPRWAFTWPETQALMLQTTFGAKLESGESIARLAPELDALSRRYPQAPDVLVFQGLNAYYGKQVDRAIELFTQAADRDPAHVEAHFLAVGRQVDLAYRALGLGDGARARAAVTDAKKLVDRAMKRSSFAGTLPRYVSQVAELDELVGDVQSAHSAHLQLAPQYLMSAAQAAMLSWQLPATAPAIRNGLEVVESAIHSLQSAQPGEVDAEGWSFRVTAVELISVHPKHEKLCLLSLVKATSSALQRAVPVNTGTSAGSGSVITADCGGAIRQRIVEIVCTQTVTARDRLAPGDKRRALLEHWNARALECAPELQPLPQLPPSTSHSKQAVVRLNRLLTGA